jgi:hypothetical protein
MPTTTIPAPNEVFISGFSLNDDHDFGVRIMLGLASGGGSEPGEVLATIASVAEGDERGWSRAWTELGDRVQCLADSAARGGHLVSAAGAFLRAANYLSVAVGTAARLADEAAVLPAFRRHRAAWERFIDTVAYPAAHVDIPYEASTLPGYFISPSEDSTSARPTLIMVNGSDGPISSLWGTGAADALLRGYNVLLFDGPGQQSMLYERGVPFRPDWEAVITPIVDFLLGRFDVDPARLALYGISQAGYWVPRALAFEHRIAAAIADPGVIDVGASWRKNFPPFLSALLTSGDSDGFDAAMGQAMDSSPALAAGWRYRAHPYGQSGYFETMRELERYNLRDVAARIVTPLLITNPEGEQFWPGQSDELASLLQGEHVVVPFTAAEGANLHCQPLARSLTHQRMFDWLDARLGR